MAKMPWKGLYNQSPIIVPEGPEGVKNQHRYKELMDSFHNICQYNRQMSFSSRQRYYQQMEKFIRFLANKNLGKLKNISNQHIVEYIKTLQDQGLSASTIETALSAIRVWHDQVPDARYKLADNSQLKGTE